MKQFTPYILLLLLITSFASCNDEEQFTTDSNAIISFSKDTIAFDTVFSTIGSSTKSFQVYNNNDKAIRLKNVHLASNGNSGFRINLDGVSGTSFSDIEILKKDSLFVFVEVTVNPQDADSPVLIKDSIQFTQENGKRSQVILQAYGQDIIILQGKELNEDTRFESSRPYLIYDSLVVKPNVTLTLAAGTTMCFHSQATLDVHGTLIAEGTLEKPIIFRGDRTDRMFDYLPYDRLDGQWGGINLYSESKGNNLKYVDIHGGNYGILCDSTGVEQTKLTISNSSIHNVKSYCLVSMSNKLVVSNSQFTNAKINCVNLLGGNSQFFHVTIGQFYPWAEREAALVFSNVANDTPYPLDGLYFYNSIITGYAEDEIMGSRYVDEDEDYQNSIPFAIGFNNCLVRTDTVGASDYFKDCIVEHKDSITCGDKNFKLIDTEIYAYNFELDSLSRARGIGNPNYSKRYSKDKNGITRNGEHPDAGCFEYR